MHRFRLDPASLSVASFEPVAAPGVGPSGTIVVATVTVIETIRTAAETNEEICWCMTWVPEDCFGPTAGCSTDPDKTAVGVDAA